MSLRTKYAYATAVGVLLVLVLGIWLFPATADVVVRTEPVDLDFHLHAPEETHYDHMVWAEGTAIVPHDMWVVGVTSRVEGAPHGTLHNAYLAAEGTNDLWCPENPSFVWSGGTVSTRAPLLFDPPYGIFLHEGQRIVLEAAFHNGSTQGSGEDFHNVTFELTLIGGDAGNDSRSRPLKFSMIDPTGCDRHHPIFSIPPRAKHEAYDSKKKPFVFARAAEILRARAHFHGSYEKGVTNVLRLFLNGNLVDEFTSDVITEDAARNPLMLADKLPMPVGAGDALTMEALFDNPSEAPVNEGMAIVGFYYVENE
jgi:hypothetical protein